MKRYMPLMGEAMSRRQFILAGHRAVLLAEIEPVGPIEYLYVLAVYDHASIEPCLCVAAERNRSAGPLGMGSHFLGIFPGRGHINMGASDDWGDLDKFTKEALDVARGHLGLSGDWVEEPRRETPWTLRPSAV